MEYLCLRNCYVGRLYKQGEIYDLPEDMEKHPDNFQELSEAEQDAKEAGKMVHPKTAPANIPEGSVWCPEHLILHKLTTKVGKRCKKKYGLE